MKEIELLKSEDPGIRQEAVEYFLSNEMTDEAEEIICKMITDPDKGVRNSVTLVLLSSNRPGIPALIVPYITSPDLSVRNLAGELLIKMGEKATPALLDYIDKGDDDDKKFIIDVLGLIGDKNAVPKILEVLQISLNDNVILACIEGMGNIRAENALPELISSYDKNELFKPTVIEAVGKIGSRQALDFIISKYKNEDELTRYSIIESLGIVGDEEVFFFLLSELLQTTGALVWPLISSIRALKEKFNFDIPFDERMKNAIMSTLEQSDPKYRRDAAFLISAFEDKDILLACLKIYGEDPELDENLKSKFFENSTMLFSKIHLILNENPANIVNLLWLLKEVLEFGGQILEGLSDIDKRNLCDSFTRCLEHADEEVRKSAMELLFAVNVDTALVFIGTMMEDNNLWNKLRLIELLEMVNLQQANDALITLSKDPDEMINERAKSVLSERNIQIS
jgi:HEAT repeat protein